jgi:leader peptidase (prepilin peptidase) / N-methyltransferase
MDNSLVGALLVAGVLGAAVGSFLNVIAWRIPRGESIISPRSRCTSCGNPIAWFDNLPVLSWFLLRGRCRKCRARFSIRYAIVELLTALLFAGAMLHSGVTWLFLRDALFLSLLVCTVLTDLDGWIILDSVSIGGTVAGIALSLLPGGVGLLSSALTAAGSFLLFLLIRLTSILFLRKKPGYTIAPEGHEDEAEEFQGGMGWGDIKLAAMIGAFLGPASAAVAFFAAFLTGALFGIAVLAGGRDRRIPVPFGPFMALGAVAALFAGPVLWALYWQPASRGK